MIVKEIADNKMAYTILALVDYEGSRHDLEVRALASHQCSQDSFPGLVSCDGSRSCSKYFSPVSLVFVPLQKPTLQIQLPVLKFKKRLGTSVHIVKITSYQKITQPPEISLKNY